MASQLPDTKDIPLADARETDIVIPVLGPISSGKSSFINKYLEAIGDPRRLKVEGNQDQPCTDQLQAVVIKGHANLPHLSPHSRIVLVDTPGFNDTIASDFKIVMRIRRWFTASYRKDLAVGGVIYIHDISQDRFILTAKRNLDMFLRSGTDKSLSKAVIVTSQWGRPALDTDFGCREEGLKKGRWVKLLGPPNGGSGAVVLRLDFPDEAESARRAVDSVLRRLGREAGTAIITEMSEPLDGRRRCDGPWMTNWTWRRAWMKEMQMWWSGRQLRTSAYHRQIPPRIDHPRVRLKNLWITRQQHSRPYNWTHHSKLTSSFLSSALRAGESTFINNYMKAVGRPETVPVGYSLSPFTHSIEHVIVEHKDETGSQNRLVIVDTPGFDSTDARANDGCIIDRIKDWLKKSVPNMNSLGGVIYLYDISKTSRASDAARRHLLLFRNGLGGENVPLRKIFLVTSKWDSLCLQSNEPTYDKVMETIKRDNWRVLVNPSIGAGARVMKWDKDAPKERAESARNVVESVLRGVAQERIDPVHSDVQKDDIVILVLGQAKAKSSFIEQYLLPIDKSLPAESNVFLSGFKVVTIAVQTKGRAYPYLPSNTRAALVDAPCCGHDGKTVCDHVVSSRVTAWLEASYGKNVSVGGIIYLYVDNPVDNDMEILHKSLVQLSRSCRDALTIIAELHLGKVPTVNWMNIESVDEDGKLAVYSRKWAQVGVGVEKVVNTLLSRANKKAGEDLATGMLHIQEEVSSLADAQNPGANLMNTLKRILQEQKDLLEQTKNNRKEDAGERREKEIRVRIRALEKRLERLQNHTQVDRMVKSVGSILRGRPLS